MMPKQVYRGLTVDDDDDDDDKDDSNVSKDSRILGCTLYQMADRFWS